MALRYAFFLGNHPELSLVEAWHALQRNTIATSLEYVGPQHVIFSAEKPISGDVVHELGGTDRIGQIMAKSAHAWTPQEVFDALDATPKSKKITVGLSTLSVSNFDAAAFAYDVKKIAAARDVKLRFVLPKKSSRLNAAQVEANHLTQSPNAELTLIKQEDQWLLARTLEVQDIRAYERRDTRRPARDARVGMLPPKLAQIMINIALQSRPTTKGNTTLFDPFCGMGTVLQEAWLLDIKAHGSDINERMVAFSDKNITWLSEHFSVSKELRPELFVHDARRPFPKDLRGKITHIVTEPYLGNPMRSPLLSREAAAHIEPLANLYLAALKNFWPILAPEGMVLFLLPAFRRGHRGNETFTLFPAGFLDAITELGYSQIQLIPPALQEKLSGSDRGTLLYSRPDALVGREFTLWQKAE